MTIKGLPRPSASLSPPCHAVVPSDPMSWWQAMRGSREGKLSRSHHLSDDAQVAVALQQGFSEESSGWLDPRQSASSLTPSTALQSRRVAYAPSDILPCTCTSTDDMVTCSGHQTDCEAGAAPSVASRSRLGQIALLRCWIPVRCQSAIVAEQID
jgi:hypothetical protein